MKIIGICILLWSILNFKSEDELVIRKRTIDFGVVSADTLLQARYYLINNTDSIIVINYVNPECSCTGYKISNYHIEPRDSVYVDLELNTKGTYGEQKIYTILRAETETKMYKLILKANVKE